MGSSDGMAGANSSDALIPRRTRREREIEEPADRFDRCDERSERGVRCEFEAGHNPPHSWEAVEGSLEKAISKTRNAIHRDRAEAEEQAHADPGRGMPSYIGIMGGFFDDMIAEMESNFYKGDPEPYRRCDAPMAMGEVFYHVLKLAWLVKHKPENKDALAEYTADVANCAFIVAANLGAERDYVCPKCEGDGQDHRLQEPERRQNPCPNCGGSGAVSPGPTFIGEFGDADEFQAAFDELQEWIAKHFGWSADDMHFGRSA